MDWKLELVFLPVSDMDRAKEFYVDRLGFALDLDEQVLDDLRIIQLTPPGSACSVMLMHKEVIAPVEGLHLVVPDLEAAHGELVARGADVSEPFHYGTAGKASGLHPDRRDYASFVSFDDPDGNSWLVQDVPSRASVAQD